MSDPAPSRITIDIVDPNLTLIEQKRLIPDAGRRRHLSWGMDFDSRALSLDPHIPDHWVEEAKIVHRENLASARAGMITEFGEQAIDGKIENFVAMGPKPFSILAHHNALFHQVRQSFVIGAYYPALVGACALGMAPGIGGWQFFDSSDYGDGDWTDDEFASAYNDRDPSLVFTPPANFVLSAEDDQSA